jgi:putative N-acetylmannosamine-6-phosphate epimerase
MGNTESEQRTTRSGIVLTGSTDSRQTKKTKKKKKKTRKSTKWTEKVNAVVAAETDANKPEEAGNMADVPYAPCYS